MERRAALDHREVEDDDTASGDQDVSRREIGVDDDIRELRVRHLGGKAVQMVQHSLAEGRWAHGVRDEPLQPNINVGSQVGHLNVSAARFDQLKCPQPAADCREVFSDGACRSRGKEPARVLVQVGHEGGPGGLFADDREVVDITRNRAYRSRAPGSIQCLEDASRHLEVM